MTEQEAKQHLTTILESFTPGSVLHLLAEVIAGQAEEDRTSDTDQRLQQRKEVEHTLIVVGMGIDAALPT